MRIGAAGNPCTLKYGFFKNLFLEEYFSPGVFVGRNPPLFGHYSRMCSPQIFDFYMAKSHWPQDGQKSHETSE